MVTVDRFLNDCTPPLFSVLVPLSVLCMSPTNLSLHDEESVLQGGDFMGDICGNDFAAAGVEAECVRTESTVAFCIGSALLYAVTFILDLKPNSTLCKKYDKTR